MSLDVYLNMVEAVSQPFGSGIFVRENGKTIEISKEDWDAKFPDREPIVSVQDNENNTQVYWANITHNLNTMADKAGLYEPLWRPDEINISWAHELIESLKTGLEKLIADPNYYKSFNPKNGWGNYDGLVRFVKEYLDACVEYPNAQVSVSR